MNSAAQVQGKLEFHAGEKGEGAGIDFRTDFFNAFNHTQFANPNLNFAPGASSFGRITDTSAGPRVVQFALKMKF